MSGQKRGTAAGSDHCGSMSGARRWPLAGHVVRGALVTVVVLLAVASQASAASFNWYGEGNSTCWQTGEPGAPSSACSAVGAGFLATAGNMVEGGIGPQTELTRSGDYCGYYRLGDALIYPDSINEGPATGFTDANAILQLSRGRSV